MDFRVHGASIKQHGASPSCSSAGWIVRGFDDPYYLTLASRRANVHLVLISENARSEGREKKIGKKKNDMSVYACIQRAKVIVRACTRVFCSCVRVCMCVRCGGGVREM